MGTNARRAVAGPYVITRARPAMAPAATQRYPATRGRNGWWVPLLWLFLLVGGLIWATLAWFGAV